jgi:hypothetical protein
MTAAKSLAASSQQLDVLTVIHAMSNVLHEFCVPIDAAIAQGSVCARRAFRMTAQLSPKLGSSYAYTTVSFFLVLFLLVDSSAKNRDTFVRRSCVISLQ